MTIYVAYVTGKPTDVAEPGLLIQAITTQHDPNMHYNGERTIDMYYTHLAEDLVLTETGDDYDYSYLDTELAVAGYRVSGNWVESGGQTGCIIVPIHD